MKRIALIVTGTALLVASCGIASAASKTEVTMPNHADRAVPRRAGGEGAMLAPNTAYQLLNPLSPEQLVAKAEARKHVTLPQYAVSPEQLVARAEHVARPRVRGVAGAAGRKGRARRAAPEARDEARPAAERRAVGRLDRKWKSRDFSQTNVPQ